MFNIIALALSLSAQSPAVEPVSPEFASCEWHSNATTGVSVEVCDGRAVAFKDLDGNYNVSRY